MGSRTEQRVTFGGLVFGVALVVAWNAGVLARVQSFGSEFLGTTESVVLRKEKAIQLRERPVDVLFIGDSTVDSAIDERVFERISGLSCMNLGLAGDFGTYGDMFMLKSYLAKFPPPRAVVVWHTVDVWQRSLKYPSFAFTLPDWRDQVVALKSLGRNVTWDQNIIHWPLKTVTQVLLGGLYYVSPGYRYKVWMKAVLNHYFPGIVPLSVVNNLPVIDGAVEGRLPRQLREVQGLPVKISGDVRYWFGRFLETAEANRIPVYVSRSPIHETAMENPDIRLFLDRQNADLHEFFKANDLPELRRENIVFAPDLSNQDKDHVNEKGRVFVTAIYAEDMRRKLSGIQVASARTAR